jgi:O-antigen ligase
VERVIRATTADESGAARGDVVAKPTGTVRFAVEVTLLALASWLPVAITAAFGGRVGWVLTLAIGVGVWFVSRSWQANVLVAGVVLASGLVASGLVAQTSEYMPVVVAGLPLMAEWTQALVENRTRLALPPRPVLVALGTYVTWALLSGLFSSDRRLSATYVAGMLLVLTIAFLVVPSATLQDVDRRRTLGVVATMSVIAAVSSFLVMVTGPIWIFGRPLGDYLPSRLALGGHATGLPVPRVAGVYLAPASEAMVLVGGLAALLVLRIQLVGRARAYTSIGVIAVTLALLATQSRTAWLMGAVAAGGLALTVRWLKARFDGWAVVIAVVLIAMSGLVLKNVVGTVTNASVASQIEKQAIGGDDPSRLVQVRGGTDLSGRIPLWNASAAAIRARPVLGWGPGTDALVIAPRLTGAYKTYRGLSSHSTWLRTAVEMGLPGLLALLATLLAVGAVATRRFLLDRASGLDLTWAALVATAAALTVGQFFETSLLGGLAFGSMYWAVVLGLLASLGLRRGVGTVQGD